MQPVYLKQFQTQFVFRRCKQTCFVVKLQFLPRCMEGQRGLATRKLSVRPSVSLSNAWIVTKQKKVLPRFFIPYERSFSLVHCEEEWLVGATPSTWKFGSNWPSRSENTLFQSIFTCSTVT